MRILITGAAGYIGQQLGRWLVPDHVVVGLDVRTAPDAGFPVHVGDVRDPQLGALLAAHGIEAVVHLAAVLEPSGNRERDHAIDVQGTRNVIEACLTNGVRHVTYLSSGAAYGYHRDNPARLIETDPLRGNREFSYSDHKRQVEELLADYRQTHPHLEQLIFRTGMVVGEHTNNQLTALFHRKRLLAVWGSRSPFTFTWDEDLVDAIAYGVTEGRTGIFNISGSGSLPIDEIAYRLSKPVFSLPASVLWVGLLLGRLFGRTRYGPEQLPVLRYRPVLSNAKLLSTFGWQPQKSSAEAFRHFAEAQGLGWRE